MSWRENCELVVAQIHATLPADADLKTRRRALKGKGWPAHQGTAWGRKMWGRVVREYLARHGATASLPTELPLTQLDMANAELRARRGAAS